MDNSYILRDFDARKRFRKLNWRRVIYSAVVSFRRIPDRGSALRVGGGVLRKPNMRSVPRRNFSELHADSHGAQQRARGDGRGTL